MIEWHRLLGISLKDFFTGTYYDVELEPELSLKQQRLDILIIERTDGNPPSAVPDGLENLKAHNLITYKSHQGILDDWTLDELTGHYVNYRKQISPDFDHPVPAEDFGLFAVSTRYPKKLEDQVSFTFVKEGVYDLKWGSKNIRMIVLSRIPEADRNALWLMFSAVPQKVVYGAAHYRWRQPVSAVINKLFLKYHIEGVNMPYTIEDFQREVKEEFLASLTPDDMAELVKKMTAEDRLRGLKPEDRLKGLKPEDRLRGLKPEDRLRGLKPEEILKKFKPEDRLRGLDPDEIEAYLKRIKKRKTHS